MRACKGREGIAIAHWKGNETTSNEMGRTVDKIEKGRERRVERRVEVVENVGMGLAGARRVRETAMGTIVQRLHERQADTRTHSDRPSMVIRYRAFYK